MPTFDFFNVVRKVVAAAVAAASSPVAVVLSCATLLTGLLDDIISFFSSDFKLPNITFSPIDLPDGTSQFRDLFLYAIDFDTVLDFVNYVLDYLSSFIDFSVRFFVSLFAVLVLYGASRVLRSTLKDYAS